MYLKVLYSHYFLFLLYINNFLTCVNNKVKLYADDVLLYSYIRSEHDCIALQQDLDNLTEWAHTWLMEFNIKRCEHLRITNKRNPIIHNYHLENSIISEAPHTKYLGVTIDQKLWWNKHIASYKGSPAMWTRSMDFYIVTFINILFMLRIIVISQWFAPLLSTHPLSGPLTPTPTFTTLNPYKGEQPDFVCYNDFSRSSSVTRMMSSLN